MSNGSIRLIVSILHEKQGNNSVQLQYVVFDAKFCSTDMKNCQKGVNKQNGKSIKIVCQPLGRNVKMQYVCSGH